MAHSPLLLLVATSLVLVFGAKASSSSQDNAVPTNTKAGDLLTGLLRHYSKADHPGVDGPVTISHGLSIIKLKELDVEEQSLSLVGYETWVSITTAVNSFKLSLGYHHCVNPLAAGG